MKFSIKDLFSNCDEIKFSANLVTFTKEFINGKLHFLCSVQDNLQVNIHLRCNIFAYINFHKCRSLDISRGFIFGNERDFTS